MNRTILLATAFLFALNNPLKADLISWENEVTGVGTAAAATHFSVVDGSNPINFDVGALGGARTFEFIVNADTLGGAQTLLGSTTSSQSLRFELAGENSYGITIPGNPDFSYGTAPTTNSDVHLVFVESGFATNLYVNGVFQADTPTFLTLSGTVGLGATSTATGFADNLNGSIVRFASYDATLSAGEIADHANAFLATAVPEPASFGLVGIAGIGLMFRRRRQRVFG